MCIQTSWSGERRGKDFEHGWECSTDIESEAMTMESHDGEIDSKQFAKIGTSSTELHYSYHSHGFGKAVGHNSLSSIRISDDTIDAKRNLPEGQALPRSGEMWGRSGGIVETPPVSATGILLFRLYYPGVYNGS